jgi:hypothetical protein
MGGGSKSSSSSSSRTETNTQNLALDGVEGVTVAGSESVTVNMTDNGAFGVVNEALAVLEASQAKAISTVADNSFRTLDAVTKSTIGSFEKINESNKSDTQQTVQRVTQIGIVGLLAWGATKIWGKK